MVLEAEFHAGAEVEVVAAGAEAPDDGAGGAVDFVDGGCASCGE